MNTSVISKQWDKNAKKRYSQIKFGKDISYKYVLIPTIQKLLGDVSKKKGLDIGCGPGVLTKRLAECSKRIVGVDSSKNMITIAKSECKNAFNAEFHCCCAKEYLSKSNNFAFDFLVANMFFNTIPEIDSIFIEAYRVLCNKGKFIISIAHPCFWNVYRHVISNEKYEYMVNNYSKWKFKISLDTKGLPEPVSFFHRPLSTYASMIQKAGFRIKGLYEPMPSKRIEKLYPKKWSYPHFLFFELTKGK